MPRDISVARLCALAAIGAVLSASLADAGSISIQSPSLLAAAKPGIAATPVAVLVKKWKWPNGSTLSICFYNGADAARSAVAKYATEWLGNANIKFDFGLNNARSCAPRNEQSQVRIRFNNSGGNISLIGAQSASAASRDRPSVSFAFPSANGGLQVSERAVLHEFGHVLSLHHEHQSPISGCQGELDLAKTQQRQVQRHPNYTPQQIDQNIRNNFFQLRPNTTLYSWTTPVDRRSIMFYNLPPEIFKKGAASPCALGNANMSLSETDKAALACFYPRPGAQCALSDNRKLVR